MQSSKYISVVRSHDCSSTIGFYIAMWTMGFMLSLIQNAVLELEITLENENNSKLQRKFLLICSFNVLQKYYKSHVVARYNGVLVYGGATKSFSGNIFLASYSLAFPVK